MLHSLSVLLLDHALTPDPLKDKIGEELVLTQTGHLG